MKTHRPEQGGPTGWILVPRAAPSADAPEVVNPLTGRLIDRRGREYAQLLESGVLVRPGAVEGRQGRLVRAADVDLYPLPEAPEGTRDYMAFLRRWVAGLQQQVPSPLILGPLGGAPHGVFLQVPIDGRMQSVELRPGPGRRLIGDGTIIGAYLGALRTYTDEDARNALIGRLREGENLLDGAVIAVPRDVGARRAFLAARAGGCLKNALVVWDPERDWDAIWREKGYPPMYDEADLRLIGRAERIHFKVWTLAAPPGQGRAPFLEVKPGTTAAGRPAVCHLWYQDSHLISLAPKGSKLAALQWARAFRGAKIVRYDTEGALQAALAEMMLRVPVSPVCSAGLSGIEAGPAVSVQFLGFATRASADDPGEVHKYSFDLCEKAPDAWSAAGAAMRTAFGRSGSARPQRFQRLRQGGLASRYLLFQREGAGGRGAVLYDQTRAFASYRKCPAFSGLPDPAAPMEAFAVTAELLAAIRDPSTAIEGLCLVSREETACFPLETCLREPLAWQPFPVVRTAWSRGETFEILACLVQRRARSDPFEALQKAGCGKGAFNSLIGRLNMTQSLQTEFASSPDQADSLLAGGWRPAGAPFFSERARNQDAHYGQIFVAANADPHDPWGPLLAAYVRGYQELSMYLDLLGHLTADEWARVLRIWVDGVYIEGGLTPEREAALAATDRWHEPEEIRQIPAGDETPTARPAGDGRPATASDWRDLLAIPALPRWSDAGALPSATLLESRLAILGPPGSGKTHLVENELCGDGSRAIVRAAPTWVALRWLTAGAPQGEGACTVQSLLATYRRRPRAARWMIAGRDRLVVDEMSMLSRLEVLELLALCDDAGTPLLLMGDLHQLGAVTKSAEDQLTEEWLRDQGFAFHRLEDNHRAKTPETKDMYTATRAVMEAGGDVAALVAAAQGFSVQTVRPAGLKAAIRAALQDDPRAMYLAGKNSTVAEVNAAYEEVRQELGLEEIVVVRKKVACLDSKEPLFNQERFFVEQRDYHADGRGELYVRSLDGARHFRIPDNVTEPGFAVTYHRAQGVTADYSVFLDLRGLWDPRQLYVGLTRVTELRHLCFVDEDPNALTDEELAALLGGF